MNWRVFKSTSSTMKSQLSEQRDIMSNGSKTGDRCGMHDAADIGRFTAINQAPPSQES